MEQRGFVGAAPALENAFTYDSAMRNARIVGFAVALLAATLTACGGGGGSSGPTGTLRIVNASTSAFDCVAIFPSDGVETECDPFSIAAGQTRSITVAAGEHDVVVRGPGPITFYEFNDVFVTEGGTTTRTIVDP